MTASAASRRLPAAAAAIVGFFAAAVLPRATWPLIDGDVWWHIRAGEEVLRIGRAGGHDVKVAVSQENEPHVRSAANRSVRVRVEGRGGSLPASLAQLESRATRELRHPELTALADGPLALRRAEDRTAADDARTPPYELAEPQFEATIRLNAAPDLRPGELARVKFLGDRRVTLWGLAESAVARWLKRYAQPG